MSSKDQARFTGCTIPFSDTMRFHKTDDTNWVVQVSRVVPLVDKKGKPNKLGGQTIWENMTYHATLGQACKTAAQHIADGSDAETLDDYASRLTRIGRDMEEAINTYAQGAK